MIQERSINIRYQHTRLRIAARVRATTADLIVFIHGFGCAKESFSSAFAAEGLEPFSLCTFDLPGHGASSRSSTSMYSLQAYADIANLVIEQLAPARLFMVCHSMGAAAGLIAAHDRGGISHFVNVEGNLVAQDCGLVSRKTAEQSRDEFRRYGYDQFVQALQTSSRSDYNAWAQWCKHADPSALHESARSLVEWSDSEKLLKLFRSLRHKSYVYGDEDSKQYLLPRLKSVPSYCISQAGHFPMLDSPNNLYQLLADLFLISK